jgi:Flp pilus assembly protein TadD
MARIASLLLVCGLLAYGQEPASEHADRAAELVRQGDLKNAESELRKAVNLAPNDPSLLTSLGGVLGMEGRLEDANVYLARAVKLKPDDPLLRRNLVANEWQLGRFQPAQQNLELLLKANPRDKLTIFLLGMVSENMKNYSRSIALLESIPDIAASHPEARIALASSYYHLHQREKAHTTLKSLLNSSTSAQVLGSGGRVALDHRDYALALSILTEACRALPDSFEVFLLKSEAEMKLNYFSEAMVSARRAQELHSSRETQRALATAEWRAGDKAKAVSEFEKLKREFPNDPGVYETYGTLLLEGGSPDDKIQAIDMLKKAIALDKSSVEAYYQVANLELSGGHLQEALKNLEQAAQVDPDDSRVHFALSRVYRRLERNAEADRELQTYQQLKAAQN